MLDHYLTNAEVGGSPTATAETACGRTVPLYPAPAEGTKRCPACVVAAEAADDDY